jgi:ParB family chromosome partitioning protein
MLKAGRISMGHARALLNVSDDALQAGACHEVFAKQLSVRETEALVKRMAKEAKPEKQKPEPKLDPNVRAALEEIAVALGTKVNLTPRRLEIEYYSPEDLERIYSVIVKQ